MFKGGDEFYLDGLFGGKGGQSLHNLVSNTPIKEENVLMVNASG